MFTNTKCSIYAGQDKVYTESVCLSTDTKPTTGIANGSVCIEMNTGKKFMFDEASGEWVEVPSSGGGGGGGGTSGLHKAIITFEVATSTFQNAYNVSFYAGESEDTEMPVYSGCVINDGVLSTENVENIFVTNPVSVTQEVEIVNNQSIVVFTSSTSEVYTVSGDAEAVTVDGANIVKVYGDCTISTPGTR